MQNANFDASETRKVGKEVSTIKTSVVDCNETIASVDKNVSELSDNLPKIVSEQVSQIIDDKSEEEKRQSNIIFFGVPENDEGDPRLNDLECVTDLCSQSLGVNDIVVEELTRLGAKSKRGPGKHRLLRFKVTDEVKRNKLLRSAFMLKKH